jgi:hypothetical protein
LKDKILACIGLLTIWGSAIAAVGTDLARFPGTQQTIASPDKQYSIYNRDSDRDPNHSLFIHSRSSAADKKILDYGRHVDVMWSPSSDAFFVNDYSGSSEADCLLFSASGLRRLDVEDLLQNISEKGILESDHLHITCRKWNRSWLLVSVSGRGDEYPNGFDREYVIDPTKQQIRAEGKDVWHWSNTCRNPKRVAVAIMLNGETVYESVIPLCHIKSADIGPGETRATLSFTLRSHNRSFFGEPIGTPVDWSIWEAESEGESITLGVSALQGKRVLLNTLHVAKPDAVLASNFAQRLAVKTFAATSAPQTAAKTATSRQARTLTGRQGKFGSAARVTMSTSR